MYTYVHMGVCLYLPTNVKICIKPYFTSVQLHTYVSLTASQVYNYMCVTPGVQLHAFCSQLNRRTTTCVLLTASQVYNYMVLLTASQAYNYMCVTHRRTTTCVSLTGVQLHVCHSQAYNYMCVTHWCFIINLARL